MKLFTTLFFFLAWVGFITAQTLEDFNVSGNVHTIKEKTFKAKKGAISYEKGDRALISEYHPDKEFTVNRKGQLIEAIHFDEAHNYLRTDSYEYENDSLSVINEQYVSHQYSFDKFGKIISDRIITNFVGPTVSIATYSYDKSGRLSEIVEKDTTGTLHSRELMFYDKLDRFVRMERTSYFDTTIHETIYDENNRVIQELIHDTDGQISQIVSYSYVLGHLVEQTREWHYQGEINKVWNTHYNEKGDIIKIFFLDDPNEDFIEEEVNRYEYDSHGNWYQRVMILDGKGAFITEREITYH
jgi:hypothetical protein